jgi:hypothetical protein
MKIIYLRSARIVIIMTSVIALFIVSSCKQSPELKREHGWFSFVIPDSDTIHNVVDMSFLNTDVAGSSGFIKVENGHFVDGKGTAIRFFGTNLTFSSCFPEKGTAALIAGRLRKLGMNVVRFHHMDNQSVPDGIWNPSMKDLDPGQLDKLDWLVYQLKLHGIYSNINTHVSRNYPGSDYKSIENFNYGKGIDQFFPPYIEMQKDYARKLLTHKNPYTGTTYNEEPAVAFVEVNNENSLISDWSLLPKLNKEHKAELLKQWKEWLGKNRDYPKKAGFTGDLMGIITNYSDKTPEVQKEMLWSFLMEREMAYGREMVGYYKKELKVKANIAETQAYYSGVQGVYRESQVSDFDDMHSYWEHPNFPGKSWSDSDWTIRNSSMVTDKEGGTLWWFVQHRIAGMPLTISEYDHPAPTFFCAEMFPMLNSFAAYQNFDGIYHFTFDAPYDRGRIDNFFSSAGHPLKQIFVPVGAVLFRMGAVQPGQHPIELGLPPSSVLENMVKTGDKIHLHGSNMRYIWKDAGATPGMAILHPVDINVKATEFKLTGPVISTERPWESETGEIIWDNRDSLNAVYKINSPSARAAIGYIGGKSIELGDVTIAMDTTKFNWATITITALDGKPVETSSRILLVAAGRVENTGWKWNTDKTSLGTEWGIAPTVAEGIPASLIFKDMDKFRVFTLDPAGNKGNEVPVAKKGGDQSFGIGSQYKTLWYIIER